VSGARARSWCRPSAPTSDRVPTGTAGGWEPTSGKSANPVDERRATVVGVPRGYVICRVARRRRPGCGGSGSRMAVCRRALPEAATAACCRSPHYLLHCCHTPFPMTQTSPARRVAIGRSSRDEHMATCGTGLARSTDAGRVTLPGEIVPVHTSLERWYDLPEAGCTALRFAARAHARRRRSAQWRRHEPVSPLVSRSLYRTRPRSSGDRPLGASLSLHGSGSPRQCGCDQWS